MGSAPSKGEEPRPNKSTKDEGDSQTPFNSPTKNPSQTQKLSRKNTLKSENGSSTSIGIKQQEIADIVKTGAAAGQPPTVPEHTTSATDIERDALKQQLLDSEAMMKGMMAQMTALASKVNEVKSETPPTIVVDAEVVDDRLGNTPTAVQSTKKRKKKSKGKDKGNDTDDVNKEDDLNNTGEFSRKKQLIPVSTLDPTSPERRNAAKASPVVVGEQDLPALRNESLPLIETHLHNFDVQNGGSDTWPDSLIGSRASSDFSEPPEIAAELAAAARTPRPKSASQHGRPKSGHRRKIDDQVFERFAVSVFRLADTNYDNFLSVEDLQSASSSEILNMELDKDVAKKLFKKATKNNKGADVGLLSFEQFKPVFRMLLQRNGNGEDEWVHVGYTTANKDALPVYFNSVTGEMVEMAKVGGGDTEVEQQADILDFEPMVRVSDGVVLTTCVDQDSGHRYFVDGDKWTLVPKTWTLQAVEQQSPAQHTSQTVVQNSEENVYFTITEPTTGKTHQGVQSVETATTKKYLNNRIGKWMPIPASWEASQADVAKMLKEIDEVLPDWKSMTEQVLALRMCNYNVQDAMAWKYNEVQCNGGTWSMPTVRDAMLIQSLEEELKSQQVLVRELKKAGSAADVISEEQIKDLREMKRHVDDTNHTVERQKKRIALLEEELQTQFEDAQRATRRQRSRIANLETELEIALKQSDGAVARQGEQVRVLEDKISQMLLSNKTTADTHNQRIQEMQIEVFAAKRENLEGKQLKEEVESLRAQLSEVRMQAISAAEDDAQAGVLKQQLTIATQQVAELEKYKKEALETKVEVEQQKVMISNLKESSSQSVGKQVEEINETKAELEKLKLRLDGNANISASELMMKDEEVAAQKVKNIEISDKLDALKRSSVKMMSKLKFAIQNLRASNDVMKRDAGETVTRAVTVYKKLQPGVHKLIELVNNFEKDKADLLRKYQKEVTARKLLYNQIQELKGNIRTFCRVRRDDRIKTVAVNCLSEDEILVPVGNDGRTKCYSFDKVYSPEASQADVFEDAAGIIQSVIDGYNVCYLAYGQTGSGKTFTMMGPPDVPELAGVNRRAVNDLFNLCKERTDHEFKIEINMVEIYNDTIYDVLAGHHDEPLRLKQMPDGSTVVDGMQIREVKTPDDVTQALSEADENRSVAATAMNMHSSRSHLVLQITVSGVNTITDVRSVGKLSLVDLAGSERVNKSEAKGQRLVEAVAINKSLTALGMIFNSLATRSKHVPYRNSKLTHLLQDSLGGDAKACMFLNVSPAEDNLPETRSTLNFGQSIGKIEMGPIKKNLSKKPH